MIANRLSRVRIELFFAQGLADDLGLHHWLLLEATGKQINLALRLLVLLLKYQMVLLIRAAAPTALCRLLHLRLATILVSLSRKW